MYEVMNYTLHLMKNIPMKNCIDIDLIIQKENNPVIYVDKNNNHTYKTTSK